MTALTAGGTPANQVSTQVRAGITVLTATNRFVQFNQPMPDANYIVLLEPSTPQVSIANKSTAGFTISGHAAVTVGWLAVKCI